MKKVVKPLSTDRSNSLLNLIQESLDLRGKTQPLEEDEEKIRQFILRHFSEKGRAPNLREIESAIKIEKKKINRIFEKLNSIDIIYLKEGKIIGAYPFSDSPTDFQITFSNGRKSFAMCAIDALGIPLMVKEDIEIDSSCAYCGKEIGIKIKKGEVVESNPTEPLVFAGLHCGEHAATTICTTLVFLCSREHAKDFKEIQGGEHEVLTLGEALYVGKGIFEDSLK